MSDGNERLRRDAPKPLFAWGPYRQPIAVRNRVSANVSPFEIAVIYTALGNKNAVFAWLDKAVAERSTFLRYSKWEPRLDPLRADPRFQQLLARVGLPQ